MQTQMKNCMQKHRKICIQNHRKNCVKREQVGISRKSQWPPSGIPGGNLQEEPVGATRKIQWPPPGAPWPPGSRAQGRHRLLGFYSILLDYTALCCSFVYCCTIMHCTALYCIALSCTALHCTILHCICIVLHCTVLNCTALHFQTVYPHPICSMDSSVKYSRAVQLFSQDGTSLSKHSDKSMYTVLGKLMLKTVQCIFVVYSVYLQYTIYISKYILSSILCTVYSAQYTVYSAQCTV